MISTINPLEENKIPKIKFAFFGTPDRAVIVLDILKANNLLPSLIITQPDKPKGRKQILTPPDVKVWAEKEKIECLQPEDLNNLDFQEQFIEEKLDLAIVVAYGKIIPKNILSLTKKGFLNLHGSILPKYRGSSPIETAILKDDKDTGVSIILMDEKMDHGPIISKATVAIDNWPPKASVLAKKIVSMGAEILIDSLPKFLSGELKPEPQDHSLATYTKMIKKEDGQINLSDDPYQNFLKYQAYEAWPGTFFFKEENGKKTRMKITEAFYRNGDFIISKVVPEGKKEITYRN
jgi:methionyl-tRNA formyltransferase